MILFVLLILFQLKHFFADYILQGEYMLQKFRPDWGFVKPLLAHVAVHAVSTFFIAIFIVPWYIAISLAIGDAFIHFIMDRLKAGEKYLGRYKPINKQEYIEIKKLLDVSSSNDDRLYAEDKLRSNKIFWWSIGFDQMIHHLTHYAIIFIIMLVK